MKESKPAITVAVPTLGRDGVLVDTIKQILSQKFDSFELVVVDQTTQHEAATQKFLDTCKDPRFRYFVVTPPSLPAARNFAIEQARADIVLFLDDDVIIEPDFINHHVQAFAKDPGIVAVGGRVINKTDTQQLTKQPLRFDRYARGSNTFNCDVSQFGQSYPGGNMSIKKSAIQAIGGFDTSYVGSAEREESDTAYRLMQAGGKIYFEAKASIIHLAAPAGGSRIFVPWFDSLPFYANDLLFTLKTVRIWDLPISLVSRYRDANRGEPGGTVLRRTRLFAAGFGAAVSRRLRPLHVIAAEAKSGYHIAIDARPLAGPHNGFVTYLTSIIEPLLDAGWKITLLSNRALDPNNPVATDCQVAIFGPLSSWRWEQSALPAYLRDHPVDLYFAGANRGIPWQSVRPRTILGLLDVIPYKFPRYYLFKLPFGFIRRELAAQLSSILRADAIITISNHSAKDIRRYFRRSATPLLIKLPDSTPLPPVKPLNQFVYLGGVDPRKRIDNLLRAFSEFSAHRTDYTLILIGGGFEVFDGLCRQLGINDKVVRTGYLSDAAKRKTIHESRAMVYPSLYEGYGLAIVEGFQADIPVIAGVGGAQAEIGGEAVRYIDPNSSSDIAAAMEEVLDNAIVKRWQRAGQGQLKHLTDPSVADNIITYFADQAERARQEQA